MRFIDEYDERVFWEELATRLAERDLVAEEMLRAEGSRSEEERIGRLLKLTARYEEEFAENGIDNVRVALEAGTIVSSRETLTYCIPPPGEGSPGIFGGDKPLKMERFESRASWSAS